MFVSVGVRALLNVEALNMVETAGNVARHRTVPVVVEKGPGQYVVRWVPAISGEALAHRYQVALVELAKSGKCKDRLDYWSAQGEFLKHFDLCFYENVSDRLFQWERDLLARLKGKLKCEKSAQGGKKGSKEGEEERGGLDWETICKVEVAVVSNSVVEDVGGFLITNGPVKRTSRVEFSFAIPTVDSLEAGAAQVDVQMQVRHAPQAGALFGNREGANPQMPYYVQVASAVYGFVVNLDLAGVGVSSYTGEEIADDSCPPAYRRCLAVKALEPILDLDFGAKRSRYSPHGVVELALAVVSDVPVPVASPSLKFSDFVNMSLERAQRLKATVVAWTMKRDVEEALKNKLGSELIVSSSAEDFIKKILEAAEKRSGGRVSVECGDLVVNTRGARR